ncbi:hypothetical protein DIS16_11920 [Levilactobacillus brevis]|nr:hypothetical protein DIS16_11920 [Levilactobacillus brevis]
MKVYGRWCYFYRVISSCELIQDFELC